MTLRAKLVVALAVLAAVAAATIGLFSYRTTRVQLDAEIDRSLDQAAREVGARRRPFWWPGSPGGGRLPTQFGQVTVQVVRPDGSVLVEPGGTALPVDDVDRELATARRRGEEQRRDVDVDDEPFRVLTLSLGDGEGAVMLGRNVGEYERLLGDLLVRIGLATGVVAVVASGAGWLVARQVTRRLSRVTAAAEEVASTGCLDVAVPVEGSDEAGRLGAAFNGMLSALAVSRDDQRRLVQDAGHELRTPLTSLRTNVEVLNRHELAPDVRRRVLADMEEETRELTGLVNELIQLATEQRTDEPSRPIELGELAREVAERVGRRTRRRVAVEADDSTVEGQPRAVERAISNLVENAAKFDRGGTEPIEVVVTDGRVEVRDRGPGIDPVDLPHVFDRFYRAAAARAEPGSGLGLSIVKDVAERHGGEVFAAHRDGGGAVIGMRLPVADPGERPRGA